MAPISTYVSFFALGLVAVSTSAVSGALHNTRSRQHSQALAARRVNAVSERSNDSVAPLEPRQAEAPKKKNKNKKRCQKHQGGGGGAASSAPAPSPTAASSPTSAAAPEPSSSSSSSGSSGSGGDGGVSGLTHVGLPDGFSGTQTNAIGSWFDADSGRDSTNGRSWCNIEYQNDMPLFAPDMKTMSPSLATYGSNPSQWAADASKYCGLEALVTYKGKTVPLYIGDAFDPSWVKTPSSIDILQNSFADLYGSWTDDKDVVLSGEEFSWVLTGYRNEDYAFKN